MFIIILLNRPTSRHTFSEICISLSSSRSISSCSSFSSSSCSSLCNSSCSLLSSMMSSSLIRLRAVHNRFQACNVEIVLQMVCCPRARLMEKLMFYKVTLMLPLLDITHDYHPHVQLMEILQYRRPIMYASCA